jgi:uncharacterized protein YbjT (DUF2867 family)
MSSEGACYAPIDAQDIARVAARVLTERGHAGKAYDLTGPEMISWEDAAEILSDVLDRTIRYIRISDEDLRQSLLVEGYSEEMAAAWVEVHQYTRRVPSVISTNVQEITGREPVTFTEFCREYAPALAD